MHKELSKLISLRNEYMNKGDYDAVVEIREKIKNLKLDDKNDIVEKKSTYVKKEKLYELSRKKKTNKNKNEDDNKYKKRKNKKKRKKSIESDKSIRLFVDKKIKTKNSKNEERIEKNEIILTKKQELLLNDFYQKNIICCNVNDFYEVFKYYSLKNNIEISDLVYFVNYFKDNFVSVDNIMISEKFFKYIKKITKDKYDQKSRKKITSLCTGVKINKEVDVKSTPIYEVILYFIENGYSDTVYKIIERIPNICNYRYNDKSIIINVLKLILDKYNIILNNQKDDKNIIEVAENVFLMLYNIDSSEKELINFIFAEYISELKNKNFSTVSRNIVLNRICKLKQSLGIEVNISDSNNLFEYIDEYYQNEIKNVRRRKIMDDIIILSNSQNISFSYLNISGYSTLKINVVDMSIYFDEGSLLDEVLKKDRIIYSNIFDGYNKFFVNRDIPSITFEFNFYQNVLKSAEIYNSLVKSKAYSSEDKSYTEKLKDINIIDIKSDFEQLIKYSLEKNSNDKFPYIVKCFEYANNYKIYTDLNYVFGKLNKDELNIIYDILNNRSVVYKLSNQIRKNSEYEIDVLKDDITYTNILMQRIIKSYCNSTYKVDRQYITEYVNDINKVKKR